MTTKTKYLDLLRAMDGDVDRSNNRAWYYLPWDNRNHPDGRPKISIDSPDYSIEGVEVELKRAFNTDSGKLAVDKFLLSCPNPIISISTFSVGNSGHIKIWYTDIMAVIRIKVFDWGDIDYQNTTVHEARLAVVLWYVRQKAEKR